MEEKICKCNICGNTVKTVFKLKNKDIIGMAEDYTQEIGLCCQCGFIFTQNPFDEEKLNNRYKNFSKFEFDNKNYILDEKKDYTVRCMRQKQFIERTIGFEKIESILEIGAASGFNLSLYKDKMETYGVEPSMENCMNAESRYGISLFCGVFNEFKQDIDSRQWDLIFLSNTLEHIVNPCDFIKECSQYNSKYMFIEVPTFDYKLVNEPYGMFCEEHVNMFTLEALQNLMNQCGYQLLNVDFVLGLEQTLPAGVPSMATIWQLGGVKEKYKVVNKAEAVFEWYIQESKAVLERIQSRIAEIDSEKKLAIWGVGHHVSMLLANTCLPEKNIVKVYDSDTRKQGMHLCNCQIEAFDMQHIRDKKIEAILLATYTAQNTLKKILEPYKNEVEVICLY